MGNFAGFIGPSYVAPSIYQDDQELINMYVEVDQTKKPEERGYAALYPTPGLAIKTIGGPGPVRGLWPIPGGAQVIAVFGGQVLEIDNNFTGHSAHPLNTSSGPLSMTDNGTEVFIADGLNRYSYNWATDTLTVLTDGITNAADVNDFVDGYVIYNVPGTQQWCATDLNAHTTNALSFGVKNAASDLLVSLFVSKREVYLLGERTTEVWTNQGLFPFPFARLEGATMQHGCVAKYSPARLGESFAWLAQDSRGESIVVTMTGNYQPVRISTHAVESDIAKFSTVADALGFTYQQGGHEFYELSFPSGDRTWVYDLATGLWHKRAWRDSMNVLHRHRANCMAFFQNLVIVGDYALGNLYTYSQTQYTDFIGGLGIFPIPCIRRAPHLTSDLRRQFFHDFQIQFQPGVGLQSGQGSNPQAMLRWSDDGGSTWSREHWKSIGKVGQYKNRARWTELGEARDRIFEVTTTDPVYRAMISAELNYSEGGV